MDSGVDFSIIPASSKYKTCNSFKQFASNGTNKPTFIYKSLTLDVGLRRQFPPVASNF